ncbi:hypothetical protein BN1723_012270 [Verticillium longisporum]|uniref:Uncharacterized protein n=1 Tax=Verticillium longisporum TaxID=100787 RepID=A0A0G4LHH3_VERLO|nr:hypothetical protein BN1723_012270 [Verticillium longisporum]
MSKRTADTEMGDGPLKAGDRPEKMDVDGDNEMGEFEDEFEDEFESESEDEILEAGVDGRPDAEREAEEKGAMEVDQGTFIVGRSKLEPGQTLAPDLTTYQMLHNLNTPFDYHKEQITSVEWHPSDDSIIAVAAGDNTVTLWDLAVELDDEESKDTGGVKDVPPQLLFVHYLSNVKELHWHPQITGSLVATGDEFSIFRTINV